MLLCGTILWISNDQTTKAIFDKSMTLKIDDKFWDFVNVRMSVGLQVLILNGSLDVCVHSYTVGMDTTNDDISLWIT